MFRVFRCVDTIRLNGEHQEDGQADGEDYRNAATVEPRPALRPRFASVHRRVYDAGSVRLMLSGGRIIHDYRRGRGDGFIDSDPDVEAFPSPPSVDPFSGNPALEQTVRRILDKHMELAWQEIKLAIQLELKKR